MTAPIRLKTFIKILFNKNMKYGKHIILLVASLMLLNSPVSAQSANATISLNKDKSSGLFILNMRDSQGIKSFSLVFPTDKLPYSGDLNGCPASRKIDNITINDPSDFKPLMNAVILDCQGNETEFEIGAPVDGVAQVKKAGIEPPPPPPPPPSPKATEGTAPPSSEASSAGGDPYANIQYPIKALGNCESKEACKTYCEAQANLDRCIAFAEANGLLKHDEIARGKKFSEIVKSGGGPAGCKTEKACFEYCNDVDRIDECVAFAEKNGFMEGKELEEAKKIQSIVRSGKSMPGNCKNRTACEAYCKNTEHLDECIAFAKENGMMSEEEIKEVEKFLPLMKSGQTPGKCKSKEECEAFCEAEANFDECFNFAEKAGLISEKEREIMKKTGGKGPGGCRGRACQTFCDNPANQKACFEFGKEYGLISDADLQRMEEGKRMLKKQLETGPPEVQECLKSVISVEKLESEGFTGGPELGEKMRECFEKLIPEGMEGQFEFGEGGEFSGPGGCKSREECEAYCKEHAEECGFGGGESGGGFSGPGGCKSREECEAYCKDHQEECKNFTPPTGIPGGGGGGFPTSGGFPGGGFGPPSSGLGSPGGCKSKQECDTYCSTSTNYNKRECYKYRGQQPPLNQFTRLGLLCAKELSNIEADDAPFAELSPDQESRLGQCILQKLEAMVKPQQNTLDCNAQNPPQSVRDRCRQAEVAYCRDFPSKCRPFYETYCYVHSQKEQKSLEECRKECAPDCDRLTGYIQLYHSFSPAERVCIKAEQGIDANPGDYIPPPGWQGDVNFCIERKYKFCERSFQDKGCRDLEIGFGESGEIFQPPPGAAPKTPPTGGGYSGSNPGGCQSAAECTTYCTAHYTDPACAQYIGGSGTTPPSTTDYQKQYEEQYKQQYEEQYKQQLQQYSPGAAFEALMRFLGR